jgi:hypothetical protein
MPGLSRLAQAMAGDGQQDGYEREMQAQTRLGQAAAQMRAADAKARQDQAETAILNGRPGLFEEQVANASGVDIPTVQGYRQRLRTGEAPQVPMGPETEDGQMGVGSMQFTPETQSRLSSAITQYLPLLSNSKDLDPDKLAKANSIFRESGLSDAIISGKADRNTVAGAQAAVSGKELYNRDATGTVLDQFTGSLNESGDLAKANVGETKAKTAEKYAQAENHKAQARAHDAQAGQIINGPKGQLVQTDHGPVFADPKTGVSVPVLNSDGTPASPKLRDIPPAQNAAIIENRKALSNIDDAMDAITKATGIRLDESGGPTRDASVKPASPYALGPRNVLPGSENFRQITDSEGVPVRAKVANIAGQRFHDMSGAAVSISEASRLRPFIPSVNDAPAAALQKLMNLRREYEGVNSMLEQTYSREQGYRPFAVPKAGNAKPTASSWGGSAPSSGVNVTNW